MGNRDRNRAEREQQVVAAASSAIAELGFSAVRVSDIAERAGMTTGHVSYYFPSKAELLMLAISTSESELLEAARKALGEIDDPWQQLEHLIDISVAQEPGDPGWVLWFEVWAEATSSQQISTIHNTLDQRWRDLLTRVLSEGMDKGSFKRSSESDTAMLISTALDGLSVQLAVGAPGFTPKRLKSLAMSLCQALLQPSTS